MEWGEVWINKSVTKPDLKAQKKQPTSLMYPYPAGAASTMAPSSHRKSEPTGVEPPLEVMLSKLLTSIFTHSFNKYLLGTYYMSSARGNKKGPALKESTLQ